MDYEKMALDNKRKVMRSSIFGDDDEAVVPVTKYQAPTENRNNYNNNYNNNNNNYEKESNKQFASISQPPSYQSNNQSISGNANFQNQTTINLPTVNNSPIRVAQIEQIEAAPSLPVLTPFPDFRFDTFNPINQFDLGVHPRERQVNKQNEKSPVLFTIGDTLMQIREDLKQESVKNSQKIQQIKNNENFVVNIKPVQIEPINKQQQQQVSSDPPQITTTSQFMYPDGTTFDNS